MKSERSGKLIFHRVCAFGARQKGFGLIFEKTLKIDGNLRMFMKKTNEEMRQKCGNLSSL